MGAPIAFCPCGAGLGGDVHLAATIEAADRFHWEEMRGTTLIQREAIGVVGLITPELADEPDRLQGGACFGRGLHHGAETLGNRAPVGSGLCRDHGGGGAFRPVSSTL
ncbi:MAG: hypothetical protein R3D84_03570 [Paracoccaceae bacterium]